MSPMRLRSLESNTSWYKDVGKSYAKDEHGKTIVRYAYAYDKGDPEKPPFYLIAMATLVDERIDLQYHMKHSLLKETKPLRRMPKFNPFEKPDRLNYLAVPATPNTCLLQQNHEIEATQMADIDETQCIDRHWPGRFLTVGGQHLQQLRPLVETRRGLDWRTGGPGLRGVDRLVERNTFVVTPRFLPNECPRSVVQRPPSVLIEHCRGRQLGVPGPVIERIHSARLLCRQRSSRTRAAAGACVTCGIAGEAAAVGRLLPGRPPGDTRYCGYVQLLVVQTCIATM